MTKIVKHQTTEPEGFFVAAFVFDGSLEGIGRWEGQSLSPKWTKICSDLLQAEGDSFDYKWKDNLSHVRTRFTSAQDGAICTFFVDGELVSSILLMRGHHTPERDVAKLFVNSLQNMPLIMACNLSEPFAEIFSMTERPLMAVVAFPSDDVSDQDSNVVGELSLHLAYAFFRSVE